jgi:hypothetical protein
VVCAAAQPYQVDEKCIQSYMSRKPQRSNNPMRREFLPNSVTSQGSVASTRLLQFVVASWFVVIAFFSGPEYSLNAAEFSVKVVDKAPPADVGESIRTVLQSKAVQLLEGEKPIYEIWFRRELPLKSKPESPSKGLPAIAETSLLGVVAVQRAQRDYKDNEIAPKLYTARFGLQPQDGDHLGTAEFPYFAVLIPVKSDTNLDGISGYKAMFKASGKETATGHPVVLSLRPAAVDEADVPKLNEPVAEHKSVRVKLPAKVGDKGEQTIIVVELVYQGHGKTQ